MNYRTSTLETVPFPDIYRCFAAAFADYAVQSAVMTEPALRRRTRKNDWKPQLSAGVWDGDELVAISLTGVDTIGGEKRGYDICTGAVPAHRGKGAAGLMMETMIAGLKRDGAEAFQLEVLQGNEAGIRAYEKGGFTLTRSLASHVGAAGSIPPESGQFQIEAIGVRALLELSSQMDFEPSFEQRDSAIAHLQDELMLLGVMIDGRCVAGIAYDPVTSWIMRLITHRDFWRRGAASALIAGLAQRLPPDAPIKAVNIDARDEASRALVTTHGFGEWVGQWEMRLNL